MSSNKESETQIADCVPSKKICLDKSKTNGEQTKCESNGSINQQKSIDFKSINFERVLSVRTDSKSIFILGSIGDDRVVIGIERIALDEKLARSFLQDDHVSLNREIVNDIYGSYFASSSDEQLNRLKCMIIHPATDKHIAKYSFTATRLLTETAADYEQITLPYIESSQLSLDWVINILEHRQEAERIVFEDPHPSLGFILLPDLKWDATQVQTLYLVAIVHARNLRSLRDLRAEHLPLLHNIRDRSFALIREKWSVDRDQIRAYIHYQPSYYHFHVHFTHIQYNSAIATCTRSHLIDTVISNLQLCSDYYAKATLPFEIREGTQLHQLFTEH